MLLALGKWRLHKGEVRVVGNDGLGEGREPDTLFAELADLLHDLFNGADPAVEHGADLHGGGFDDGAHCSLLSG